MISDPVLFEYFSGRVEESRVLDDLWTKASRENRGATLLISGEAGVGKSRLLGEFRDRLDRRRAFVVSTVCDEAVQFPYGSVISILDALLKKRTIRDSMGIATTRKRLTDPIPEATTAHASALAERYGVVVDAFADLAARTGILTIIADDVQWCDVGSLDLFRYLARELSSSPFLLILAYRSEDARDKRFAAAIGKIERERPHRLSLSPMPDSEIAAALMRASGNNANIERETVDRICELAEGKPYVAEELLRSTLDRVRRDGSGTIDLPTSLRTAVLERIDALGAFDRDVLIHAAVVGRNFDAALLAKSMESSLEAILRSLRLARNAQIVAEDSHGRYLFRHALAREILYEELLGAEVRLLHVRIADILEREASRDSLLTEIAYHRWLGRDGNRAALACERAGDDAVRLSAYANAQQFFERALTLSDRRSIDAAKISEKAAYSALAVGDVETARKETLSAIEAYELAGDRANVVRLRVWLARQAYLCGDHKTSFGILEQLDGELPDDSYSASRISLEVTRATLEAGHGEPSEALAICTRLLRAEKQIAPDESFRLQHALGTANVRLARYDEAISAYRAVERIAESIGDAHAALNAVNSLAAVAGLAGRFETARAAYASAIERARRTGIENSISLIFANASFWELLLGNYNAAANNAQAAITRRGSSKAVALATLVLVRLETIVGRTEVKIDPRLDTHMERAFATANSAIINATTGAIALQYLSDGKVVEATSAVQRGAAHVRTFGPATHWFVEATARCGDDETRERIRSLLHDFEQFPACVGYSHLFESLSLPPDGNRLERTDHARRAAAAFESTGLVYELARSYELAGDAARARALFQKQGASAEISRLDGLVRSSSASSVVTLTRREEQIARLASRGLTNREIADELRIGERTVETHVAHVYAKLRVRTRAELANYFATSAP